MGCDLRGNDLSAILGVRYLKQIVIDRAQTVELAEAWPQSWRSPSAKIWTTH